MESGEGVGEEEINRDRGMGGDENWLATREVGDDAVGEEEEALPES